MAISWVREDPQYASGVERRPELDRHLQTNVKGLHIIGAANGSPLLKTCINEGTDTVRALDRLMDPGPAPESDDDPVDIVIVGAGPAGLAAALEARKRKFSFRLLEKTRPLNTIHSFPAGKKIYAEPATLTTLSELGFEDSFKEELLEEWGAAADTIPILGGAEVTDLERKGKHLMLTLADGRTVTGRKVLLAIGRMGNPRLLGVPGEDLPSVFTTLLNPGKYDDKDIIVVGGGNSAAEAALALRGHNRVTLVHRSDDFSRLTKTNRRLLMEAEAKEENLTILRKAHIKAFREGEVDIEQGDETRTQKMDVAFTLIGTDPPNAFLKRLGVRFEGAWSPVRLILFAWAFFIVYTIYALKNGLYPYKGAYAALVKANVQPGFLYGLAYSLLMTFFGLRAYYRYRQDPYQRKRLASLVVFQWLLYFAIPWALFYFFNYTEYWRVWAVALTYPLGYYGLWDPASKLMSASVLPWAIAAFLGFIVVIPIFSVYHGKKFCSWVCPCGGLAETVGDAWRHKAPRGKGVRYFEIISTVLLIATIAISFYLIADYRAFIEGGRVKKLYWATVDIGFASIVAIMLYPFRGGRIWCRFGCPLAKWMELWGRWTGGRQAIVPNDECISCGECTRYCQMGIDVRAFAQRQIPLSNSTTSCIFCGICVTVCPVDVLRLDRLPKHSAQGHAGAFIKPFKV